MYYQGSEIFKNDLKSKQLTFVHIFVRFECFFQFLFQMRKARTKLSVVICVRAHACPFPAIIDGWCRGTVFRSAILPDCPVRIAVFIPGHSTVRRLLETALSSAHSPLQCCAHFVAQTAHGGAVRLHSHPSSRISSFNMPIRKRCRRLLCRRFPFFLSDWYVPCKKLDFPCSSSIDWLIDWFCSIFLCFLSQIFLPETLNVGQSFSWSFWHLGFVVDEWNLFPGGFSVELVHANTKSFSAALSHTMLAHFPSFMASIVLHLSHIPAYHAIHETGVFFLYASGLVAVCWHDFSRVALNNNSSRSASPVEDAAADLDVMMADDGLDDDRDDAGDSRNGSITGVETSGRDIIRDRKSFSPPPPPSPVRRGHGVKARAPTPSDSKVWISHLCNTDIASMVRPIFQRNDSFCRKNWSNNRCHVRIIRIILSEWREV